MDDELDEEEEFWEQALMECGELPPHLGGGCTMAGSEYCDFDCPFRDESQDETTSKNFASDLRESQNMPQNSARPGRVPGIARNEGGMATDEELIPSPSQQLGERIAVLLERGRLLDAVNLCHQVDLCTVLGLVEVPPLRRARLETPLANTPLRLDVQRVLIAAGVTSFANLLHQPPNWIANLNGMPEDGLDAIYKALEKMGFSRT